MKFIILGIHKGSVFYRKRDAIIGSIADIEFPNKEITLTEGKALECILSFDEENQKRMVDKGAGIICDCFLHGKFYMYLTEIKAVE
jgi:hypothetical protein